jgi:two-component system sensor histidine kinase/response regulator
MLSGEKESARFEKRYVRADGSVMWADLSSTLHRDEAGRPDYFMTAVVDITGKRAADQALMESEERYRLLVENAFVAVYLVELTDGRPGRILEANERACERLGYTRAELLATDVRSIYMTEPAERGHAVMEVLRNEGRVTFETEHTRKDGTLIPVEVRASLFVLAGKPAILSVVADISERNRTESILAARIRIAEYAPGHALDALIQKALDETEAVTGSSIGFFHFVDPDQESLRLQTWSTNTLATQCTAQGKSSHYAIDRAGVWVDCVREGRPIIHNDYAALPNRKGMPEGHAPVVRELTVPLVRGDRVQAVIGVGNKPADYDQYDVDAVVLLADLALDLVQAKQAEQDLIDSEERYAALLASLHEGVILQLRDGTIVSFNAAAERIFNVTLDEALASTSTNRDWGTITADGSPFPGDDHPSMVALRTGEPCTDVLTGVKQPDGAVRWINVSATPVSREGEEEPYAVSVSFYDVTERRHAEEELRRAKDSLEDTVAERTGELTRAVAELTEANEAKTRFIRSMSHELRTPLNSVIGFSSLMLDGLAGEVNEEQTRQLAMINNAGLHLLALINDMLDLSRIEAGRLEMRIEPIAVEEFVNGMIESVAPAAQRKGLTILRGPCVPLELVSDRTKVRQILLNLLDNAIKFTDTGAVTLSCAKPSAALVSFTVADTGPGIAPDERERIFGEFTQALERPGASGEGTGLGLAISRGLARALGGMLELETTEGEGSVFTLTLPARPAQTPPPRGGAPVS